MILTLDDPNQSANTMNAAYAASIAATVDRLESERDEITGVIITSAKKTFFAGGDLHDLKAATREHSDEIAKWVHDGKAVLRRLETLGRPVVAAVNGSALGGGLEIMLACHHRIVVDDPSIQLGFPEVQLGLLPGQGGVTRTVRMLGIVNALMQLLLQGQRVRPEKGKEIGIVDELVSSPDELIPAAKRWIAANAEAQQPWDADKKYKIPGGTPSTPALAQNLPAFPANLRKQIKGANYPAPHHIMAAAVEGAQVDFDNASEIEGRYFVDLVTGQVAKNMIQAFFFDLQQAIRRARPPCRDRRVQADQDGRPRRRHDGRRDRLRVRQGGARGRPQGRLDRGRASTARATRRSSSPRRSSAGARPRSRPMSCSAGSRRPPTRRPPTAPSS